jgi:hypothetical protein
MSAAFATEDASYEIHYTLIDPKGKETSHVEICDDGGEAQRFAQGVLDVKTSRLERIEQIMVTRRPCEMEDGGWLKIKGMTSVLMGNDYTDEKKLPVPLNKIRFTKFRPVTTGWGGSPGCGGIVAVRPVSDDKTYLGVFLCDLALHMHAEYNDETGVLDVRDSPNGNPMILIPELKKVIFGRESWWGPIKDENHLRKITNESIDDLWYVKLLKQMLKEKAEEEEKAPKAL